MSRYRIRLDGKEFQAGEFNPDKPLLSQLRDTFSDLLPTAVEVQDREGRHLLTDNETLTDLGLDFEPSLAFYTASRPSTSVILDGKEVGAVQLNSSSALLPQLQAALPDRLPATIEVQRGTERKHLDSAETLDSLGLGQPTSLLLFPARKPPEPVDIKRLLVPALIALLLIGGVGIALAQFGGSGPTPREPTAPPASTQQSVAPANTTPAAAAVTGGGATASTSSTATEAPTDAAPPTAAEVAPTSGAEAAAVPHYGDTAETAIRQIQADGSLLVGARFDAPPFGSDPQQNESSCDYKAADTSFKPEGFDIKLISNMMGRWIPDKDVSNTITWRCVRLDQRIPAVNTTVAIGAFALTKTLKSCGNEGASCSTLYVEDGLGLLVKNSSGIDSVCKLDGKKVAVVKESSAEILFVESFKEWCNYNTLPSLVIKDTRPEAIQAVKDGEADAYSTSVSILKSLFGSSNTSDLVVVEDAFAPESIVLATARTEPGLLKLINLTIEEMKADGTYDKLYKESFGDDTAPTNIRVGANPRPEYVKLKGAAPVPTPAPPVTTYTVQRGETLGYIARKVYGDWSLYPCIQHANKMDDPKNVRIQQVLTIPPKETCS